MKKLFIAVLMGLFAVTALAAPKKKVTSTPAGEKVASGKQFDIYAELKKSSPLGTSGITLNIYSTTVVVHNTRKHGRQLFMRRMETTDADLLDHSMWNIADLDGDGFDDYRAVTNINKDGCHSWATQTWLPKDERFTIGTRISYMTDAGGKEVKSCFMKKRK